MDTLSTIPVVYTYTFARYMHISRGHYIHTRWHIGMCLLSAELHVKVSYGDSLICNSTDHIYPCTRGDENHHQWQNMQNAVRSLSPAELLGVIPARSNTHSGLIGERAPKYFTVREREGLQFISIACALGQ